MNATSRCPSSTRWATAARPPPKLSLRTASTRWLGTQLSTSTSGRSALWSASTVASVAGSDQQNPVHAGGPDRVRQRVGLADPLVDRAVRHRDPGRGGLLLGAVQHGRPERVAGQRLVTVQRRKEEADVAQHAHRPLRRSAAIDGDHRGRRLLADVAEVSRRLQHALAHLVGDVVVIVEHARDRDARHRRGAGHVMRSHARAGLIHARNCIRLHVGRRTARSVAE